MRGEVRKIIGSVSMYREVVERADNLHGAALFFCYKLNIFNFKLTLPVATLFLIMFYMFLLGLESVVSGEMSTYLYVSTYFY